MNLQEIKKVIVSQREEMDEKFRVAKIVEREPDVNNLRQFLTNPNILAILGIRRYGKSIFSWQIFRNEMFGYINFDDERLFGFRAKDFDLVLQAFYELYGNIDYIIWMNLKTLKDGSCLQIDLSIPFMGFNTSYLCF